MSTYIYGSEGARGSGLSPTGMKWTTDISVIIGQCRLWRINKVTAAEIIRAMPKTYICLEDGRLRKILKADVEPEIKRLIEEGHPCMARIVIDKLEEIAENR